MSDEWVFYPCEMGNQAASVFYDHGVWSTVDASPLPLLLKVRVGLKDPEPEGTSAESSYQRFCGLEDAFRKVVEDDGGLYVGRITVGGYRYLHVYTAEPEAAWSPRLRVLGEAHGYELRFMLNPDPDRVGYWEELFPDEDSWQLIQDMRVLETLMKHGDDGVTSRRIDHWAYFPEAAKATAFADWLGKNGYLVEKVEALEEAKHGVRFSHQGTVELSDISRHTITLRRQVSEMSGEYDGWETQVCTAKEVQTAAGH